MGEFCHLHNHSYYSLLDGLTSPEDLAKCAAQMGFKALALTDHGSCGGLYSFQKACKEHNIKPILGMEAYTTDDYKNKDKDSITNHLIILAKNQQGYRNLCKLSSIAFVDGFYRKPRIDFDLLEKYKEGLIVSTACIAGAVPYMLWHKNEKGAIKLAGRLKETFGEDFYIEVMVHKYPRDPEMEAKEKKLATMLYKMSKKMGIKAICTNDVHYAHKEDAEAQDVLLSIQTIDVIKNPDRMTFSGDEFYLRPHDEMAYTFRNAPELLSNTWEIAEKIDVDLIKPSNDSLPIFKVPEGFKTEDEYLTTLVVDGMKSRNLYDKPPYRKRMEYELSVIIKCGYVRYFLVLWDILNYARQNRLTYGMGRGSGVSSLCLYSLGITKIDPLKYDLIFERFLNPERVSPPDVDMDFDYDRRHEIYEYIVTKYGAEYCTQIGTYNSYKAKAAIRATVKAMDLANDWEPYQAAKKSGRKVEMGTQSLRLAGEISDMIPAKVGSIEEALRTLSIFKEKVNKYPRLIEYAMKMEGCLSSAGVHPAGIIICNKPVMELIPLRTSHGSICSQYDMNEVDKLGLLKFDMLALKTLTVIDRTLKMIKERTGKEIDVDSLEFNDKRVFAMLSGEMRNYDNKGVFQFEAYGISKLLQNIRVDRFEDMVVANALYRPGPLGANMHTMYCDFKHGRSPVKFLHPMMGEALKTTYGLMIFQEQVMKISQVMAGFTGGQADTLRKVMGKKQPELIKKEKLDELFINGCVKNGIKESIAKQIFDQMYNFSGYGFNMSHSCGYAATAYQTAWLKIYYPLEFMCNLLTSEINNSDKGEKLLEYIHAAERMGINIKRQSINKSGAVFKIEKGVRETNGDGWKKGDPYEFIRIPFTMLKGVGAKAAENIVQHQPFKNIEDFLSKVDTRVVDTRVFTTLVEGACMMEDWRVKQDELLRIYPQIKEQIDKQRESKKKKDKDMDRYGAGMFIGEFDFSGSNVKV